MQTIDSFTEHEMSHRQTRLLPMCWNLLPPNTFTVQPPVTGNGAMTVIVLGGFGPFIRDQLKDYFQTATLTTPTAIFRIDWEGMHLIQGFTTDRAVLLEAATSQRIWPPLGPRFHSDPTSFRTHILGTPTQRLAAYLAGIPGRINLIWIGGGAPAATLSKDFPDESLSFEGVASMVSSLNRTADVRRLSRVVLYTIDASGVPLAAFQTAQAASDPFTGEFSPAAMEPVVGIVADSGPAFASRDVNNLVAAAGGRAFRYSNPKDAIARIAATGSHYYTISYRPTNSDWNGAYRRIHVDVTGYAQPPFSLRWSQLITGWADDVEPTLMYRQGYLARSTPARDTSPDFGTAALDSTTPNVANTVGSRPALAPRRRLISVSPAGAYSGQLQAALAFASLTPTQVHFTIVAAAAPEKEKTKVRDDLPTGNFLTAPFRDGPYRNYHIHYWIDPQDLHFVRAANGLYHDDLKTIAIVYRDDGLTANSYATTTHFDLTAADLESIQLSGFTLDQTLAIPTTDHFFLRAAVSEDVTGHIGALEIPIEWIKLPPQNPQLASKPAP